MTLKYLLRSFGNHQIVAAKVAWTVFHITLKSLLLVHILNIYSPTHPTRLKWGERYLHLQVFWKQNYVLNICGCIQDFTPEHFVDETVADLKDNLKGKINDLVDGIADEIENAKTATENKLEDGMGKVSAAQSQIKHSLS